MRKVVIWLVSLAAAMGMYLLYSQISGSPPIDPGAGPGYGERFADVNAGGGAGKIGDVSIDVLGQTKFEDRDPNTGRVWRQFGYAEVLHKEGEVWEILRPYMNLFRRGFECYVKADKGLVEMESAARRPTAKDATFSGNVVIHIVPAAGSKVKESFIYLDDVVFLSERSQLSTAGPVRFESENANMTGRGLELIFNEQTETIEYVRLVHLESGHYRGPKASMFSGEQEGGGSNAVGLKAGGQAGATKAAGGAGKKTAVAAAKSGGVGDDGAKAAADVGQGTKEKGEGEYYKCIIRRNVLVETTDQVIFADDEIVINDIFWSKDTVSEPNLVDANDGGATKTVAAAGQAKEVEAKSGEVADVNVAAGGAKSGDANTPGEEIIDVVVRCEGDVIFLPANSNRTLPDLAGRAANTARAAAMEAEAGDERARFGSWRIEYASETGDVAAEGDSVLRVYTNDVFGGEPNEPPVPVTIEAVGGMRFWASSNQAVFEKAVCRVPQQGLSVEREAMFSAPRLTVNLVKDESGQGYTMRDAYAEPTGELEFFVEEPNDPNDPNASKGGAGVFPVTVSGDKGVKFLPDSNEIVFEDCLVKMPQPGAGDGESGTLASRDMVVDTSKMKGVKGLKAPEIRGRGPVKLEGLMSAFGGKGKAKEALPAILTAKEYVYNPASNEVIFRGECEGQMTRTDPNGGREKYVLTAPEMVATLRQDVNESRGFGAGGFERLRAGGGVVNLADVRMRGEQVIGGVMLRCRQFDYDPNEQIFRAEGPGQMWVNNSDVRQTSDANQVSLRKPCYAMLENFDTLEYFADSNQIVADANSQGSLVIKYWPIIEGKRGKGSVATAGRAEVTLTGSEESGFELATLTATEGITYAEESKDEFVFIGSRLFYDVKTGVMKVSGDATQPCYFRGMLVEGIEYDLKTGSVRAKPVGPGSIELGPGSPLKIEPLKVK
ncbi:MAG: hypothetical protein JSU94_02825 [Phycisphaerales bacterium]|nr:MAG: hypothetical protein JSU94_02825 [Phycisphaerales bacterium]